MAPKVSSIALGATIFSLSKKYDGSLMVSASITKYSVDDNTVQSSYSRILDNVEKGILNNLNAAYNAMIAQLKQEDGLI